MKNTESNVKALFEPKSIAIIGASQHKGKIGYKILENIVAGGYKGKIYPINPKGGEILGIKAYKDIEDIPGEIDVATIVLPANLVFESLKGCAAKKVKFLSIISSGFSEIGNVEEERKIASYARENNMRILGPNIFGFFSAGVSLNATFGPKAVKPGGVAIITQSGALGVAMIGKTAVENIGLSAIISVGNKSDIDETDLLKYLISHKETKVIMMYIEGIKEGARLVETLKEATTEKPVVVVKSGRSKRGAIAAASHTGSLAGSDDIFDAIMKQCNVQRAENIRDALEWCKFLSNSPVPSAENAIIITNGGGIGVLATDACEKYGIKLYDDYEALKKTFAPVMPYFGSAKNPIDLTGQAESSHYSLAFATSLKNKNISSLISLYCETAVFDIQNFEPLIEETYQKYKTAGKPIVFCLVGGEKVEECVKSLRRRDVPAFNDPYEAVSCLGALYSYANYHGESSEATDKPKIDVKSMDDVIKKVRTENRNFLLSNEGQSVMKAAGIPTPQSRIARNINEAADYAEKIGYPLVMKIVSKDILHKSDVGGVALDLQNKNEVVEAYEAIINNCRTHNPAAAIDGVEISEMVPRGTELIIGARRDPSFGPIVMFGLGGIYVEVMKDVSFRAIPVSRREILSMIKQIKSYPLLLGVRGEPQKDVESVIDSIIKVSGIIESCPAITDIEINPLVVYEKGVKALDARILISRLK
ncbi:MAG: acetate--CoA ligase family protein [Planctomycetes bacterium]|nr:acetate--CoA ligase family protein [Planctomycetota bacterium]